MAKHNEDSPRYTPPVDPAAVPVEIGVCRLELSRHVCLELSWHVYTHNTYMCMWPHARMLHDQRIAAELAIRTPATIHPNPRISGFAADLAAECAENRRGFSPPPTSGIPLRLARVSPPQVRVTALYPRTGTQQHPPTTITRNPAVFAIK